MKIFIFILLAVFAAADHPVPHTHHNTYLYHGHYPGKFFFKLFSWITLDYILTLDIKKQTQVAAKLIAQHCTTSS